MCGRYSLAGPSPAQLRERFALGDDLELRQRFNVCPGDEVACVTTDREGVPRGELLRWGFVPHWAKDTRGAFKRINARAETVAERPAYRDAFRTHRCLVIADGFYEWQPRPSLPKLPWWISLSDGLPFAFAGLWARWRAPDGSWLSSCAIVTTEANSVLRELHDRMPVMLGGPGEESAWLAQGTDESDLQDLLRPLPEALTATRAVGTAVNDARYDGPECLAPATPDELAPSTLF